MSLLSSPSGGLENTYSTVPYSVHLGMSVVHNKGNIKVELSTVTLHTILP